MSVESSNTTNSHVPANWSNSLPCEYRQLRPEPANGHEIYLSSYLTGSATNIENHLAGYVGSCSYCSFSYSRTPATTGIQLSYLHICEDVTFCDGVWMTTGDWRPQIYLVRRHDCCDPINRATWCYLMKHYYYMVSSRDQLIWQIEEFLYRHSIPGMIYHIRANAFRFFGLWCSHSRAIWPNFGVKFLFKMNSIHLDWITFRLHKLSSFTILHWMTLTFESIPLWKVVYWNPIIG